MAQETQKVSEFIRLPPHSLAAERAILGSLMSDGYLVSEAVTLLSPKDFYADAHQHIFEAFAAISDKGHQPDMVAVSDWLAQKSKLDDCGGPAYLAELFVYASAGSIKNHAETVIGHAVRRGVQRAGREMIDESSDLATSPEDVLAAAERKIFAIADRRIGNEPVTLQQAIGEAYDRLDKRQGKDKPEGVTSGLLDLDALTAGFGRADLVILAARPSVGKTALGLQIAAHAATGASEPILFLSLEQARIELADRLLCAASRIDSHRMRRGHLSASEVSEIVSAGDALGELKLHINDAAGQNLLMISASARRFKQLHGLKMLVIDYLQLVEPDTNDRRASRQEQVSSISRRLKSLAKELNVPVLALAQLNRGVEDRAGGRPRLSDLRESGSIEQDADTVILMHRHENNSTIAAVPIELIVAKQRNGMTGDVTVMYVRSQMRFENSAIDHNLSGIAS